MFQCQKPNENLSEEDWGIINWQCITQCHLCSLEDIRERITEDEETLRETGITFKQLEDFFKKIFLYFKTNSQDFDPSEYTLIKAAFPGFLITEEDSTCVIFGNIRIVKVSSCGAERCPFQFPDNKCSFSHDYGSHDWFFLNKDTMEVIHIGDLLFHQICEHHFFQSPCSPYRVDPLNLLTFSN